MLPSLSSTSMCVHEHSNDYDGTASTSCCPPHRHLRAEHCACVNKYVYPHISCRMCGYTAMRSVVDPRMCDIVQQRGAKHALTRNRSYVAWILMIALMCVFCCYSRLVVWRLRCRGPVFFWCSTSNPIPRTPRVLMRTLSSFHNWLACAECYITLIERGSGECESGTSIVRREWPKWVEANAHDYCASRARNR